MTNPFDGSLEGKVAIITGGASGIGAATARRFASRGARLMLADLNSEGLSAVAKEIDGDGDSVAIRTTDVGDRHQVEALTEAAVERFGRLDIVFNNAGIGTYGQTPDLDPDAWHRIIDVDLHAVFYGCRAAIPHLRKSGGGSIINTASISGLYGDYGLAAYNAAKGALVNFTKALAIDHARENIRVNAVCPGAIETGLTAPMRANEALMREFAVRIPMGRMGRPEEIADLVAFLASDAATYITGSAIVIDGGLTAATGQPNFTRSLEESREESA